MLRLVTLLLMFALAFANAPAVASALCQHEDARAHAAALQSENAMVAAAAHGEEAAANAAAEKASLGDAAATLIAGCILPPDAAGVAGPVPVAECGQPVAAAVLAGLSVPPLLEPPLA